MGFATKQIRKAKETYWMQEFETIVPYGLNDRIGDEFKTYNKHIIVATKFSSLPKNTVVLIVGKVTKLFRFFYQKNF